MKKIYRIKNREALSSSLLPKGPGPKEGCSLKFYQYLSQSHVGFTLISAIMAVGLSGVVVMLVTSLVIFQSRETKFIQQQYVSASLRYEILQIFKNPSNCYCQFRSYLIDTAQTTQDFSVPSFDSGCGANRTPVAFAGRDLGHDIKIGSVTVKDIRKIDIENEYFGELHILYNQADLKRKIHPIVIPLQFTVKSGGGGGIQSCGSTRIGNIADNISDYTPCRGEPGEPHLVNGGGFVAYSAHVVDSAHIGPQVQVCSSAEVLDNARIEDNAIINSGAKVYGSARVYDQAVVKNGAVVYDNAQVYGSAFINSQAQVYDSARVYDQSSMKAASKIYGNAQLYGAAQMNVQSEVYGSAKVYGNIWLTSFSKVYDQAEVYGQAMITNTSHVYGSSKVYEFARIQQQSRIYGTAEVYGQAAIVNTSHVYGSSKVYEFAQIRQQSRIYGTAEVYGTAIKSSVNVSSGTHTN